jgi:hypothetical protein
VPDIGMGQHLGLFADGVARRERFETSDDPFSMPQCFGHAK